MNYETDKKSTFKILFYLKKNGNAPVIGRITIGGTAKTLVKNQKNKLAQYHQNSISIENYFQF